VTHAPLVVGFDLDLTLIDTRPGFAACLAALGEETGVRFDVDGMVARLGPPLEVMLEPYFPELPPHRVRELVDRFRALYPELAVPPVPVLEGAHEALAAVRARGGRTLVVTGKHAPNAWLHVETLGLDVDVVVGSVWGPGKGPVLTAHGASVFVGDHVHDVEGARAAGVHSVSVLTGGCQEAELLAAGTDMVLPDLGEFPCWLDRHLTPVGLAEENGQAAGDGGPRAG
jgi:phosphoglycolate phosphatase-like HAD superfamily hydrolase